MRNIEEIRSIVRREGEKIGAPPSLLSVPSRPRGDGSPHIEIQGSHYNYVVSERGLEISRKSTTDEDELCFWILSDIAANMSQNNWSDSRRDFQGDPRRFLFQERLRIMGEINPKWVEKEKENIEEIIKKNPIDDYVNIRAEHCKFLIKKGLDHQVAYKKALEKYPIGTFLDS